MPDKPTKKLKDGRAVYALSVTLWPSSLKKYRRIAREDHTSLSSLIVCGLGMYDDERQKWNQARQRVT